TDHGLRTAQYPSEDRRRYPAGYREYPPVVMLLKSVESSSRGASYRITKDDLLSPDDLREPWLRAAFDLAFEPLRTGDVDFLKSPQLALCIPALFHEFPDGHVVALWRHPRTTFRSLVQNEFPWEMRLSSGVRAVLLWNVSAFH